MAGHATLTCDEFLDAAAAVALDATDSEEARRVEEHAAACPTCRAILDEFRATAAALASAVLQHEPPAELRAHVLAAVDRERRPLPFTRRWWRPRLAVGPTAAGAEIAAAASVGAAAPGVTAARAGGPRRLRRGLSPAWLVAAASLIVAVAALAWVALLQVQLSELRSTAVLASERAARFDRVVNVLASDQLSVRPLQPAIAQLSSSGYVFMDPNSGTGMLMCHDLPPVEQGHAYQVWFVRANDRISAGMLWPDRRGDGYTLIQVPQDLQSFDSIGLTDEPGSGSQWPTTAKVMGTALR